MKRIAAGLLATLLFGVWIRWRLAGVPIFTSLEQIPFSFARHAHSHLGYYALLIPLAWSAWAVRGQRALSFAESTVYGVATVLATVGFLRAGYGVLAIVGSTVVALQWMLAAWRMTRAAPVGDLLRLMFPGTLFSLAWIPVIAISLRRDPALSAAAVQTFLAALMFTVVVPSALVARGILRQGPPPLVAALGLGGAVALGAWNGWPARLFLAGYALWWLSALRTRKEAIPESTRSADGPFPLRLSLPWAAAGLGLLAMSSGLVPAAHDIGIAAVHYLVLGPLLPMFVDGQMRTRLRAWSWAVYQASVAAFATCIALRAFVPAAWPTRWAAIMGTFLLLWWSLALWRSRSGASNAPVRKVHAA
ncbi:MAG: hypothetical protein C0503_06315 [Gemmatimonas sp.]|nr:hypothetical protein [Gemmatimonas sp.]